MASPLFVAYVGNRGKPAQTTASTFAGGISSRVLDTKFKEICKMKHPVGCELFGDNFAEQLKAVAESNRAAHYTDEQFNSVTQ